jgi:hypothetical protein
MCYIKHTIYTTVAVTDRKNNIERRKFKNPNSCITTVLHFMKDNIETESVSFNNPVNYRDSIRDSLHEASREARQVNK